MRVLFASVGHWNRGLDPGHSRARVPRYAQARIIAVHRMLGSLSAGSASWCCRVIDFDAPALFAEKRRRRNAAGAGESLQVPRLRDKSVMDEATARPSALSLRAEGNGAIGIASEPGPRLPREGRFLGRGRNIFLSLHLARACAAVSARACRIRPLGRAAVDSN